MSDAPEMVLPKPPEVSLPALNGRPTVGAFIPDGYTRNGYIKEEPLLYPAVRFQYRPLLTGDQAVIQRAINISPDARQQEQIAAETIVNRVVSWDIVDDKGHDLPITASNALRIPPVLFNRIHKCCMGREGGDADPQWGDVEVDAVSERQFREALAGGGQQGGEIDDAKN